MVNSKKKLEQFLPAKLERPELRRGKGVHLTTEVDGQAQEQPGENSRNVDLHKSTNVEISQSTMTGNKDTKVKRRQPGWELRTDLIKATQRMAIDEDKYNYEIVEDALEVYLKQKGKL